MNDDKNAELLRELRAIQPKYDPRFGKWVTLADSMLAEIIAALATAPQDATSNAEGRHPDDIAVDRFAAAMKEKLAVKRAQGRSGWDDPEQCSLDYLVRLFHDHVSKGDPIDIGNFAMMFWIRTATTNLPTKYKRIASAPPPQQQDDCVRVAVKMPEEFAQWFESQVPPGTVISNPRWWAPKIYRALLAAAKEPVAKPKPDPLSQALNEGDGVYRP